MSCEKKTVDKQGQLHKSNISPASRIPPSLVVRVAFQGEFGAFSEEAVVQQFGESVKRMPLDTLSEVFKAVERRQTDSAVVPVENSLEGSINETYDLLLESKLKIAGEVRLRIRHCLVSKPSASLRDIRIVYSHPMALAQCRMKLKSLGVEIRPFYDTAGGARFIADSPDNSLAAVASSRAAKLYMCKILLRDIADSKSNFTRFLVLRREALRRIDGPGKTSLVFSTDHRPGALHRALEAFADHGINLTKIESRPTKHVPWEYYFFVDFEGTIHDKSVIAAIVTLRRRTRFVKYLGSYPGHH